LSLMRGGAARREGAGVGSTEAVVRLAVALLRRKGANIRLRLEGDLSYSGPDVDAVRVVHNLLFNAVREIQRIGGGASVRIELRASGLSIANPVRDEARLSEKMYTRGASGEGSTGLGLAITRESAARVGWCVRHELREGHVWFFVEPDRQRTEQTPDRTAA
jgi:signal transduction histidine kinase